MNPPEITIRPAYIDDGAAVAEVYAPYVRNTAISFEIEAPTADMMAERIAGTITTHPWLIAEYTEAWWAIATPGNIAREQRIDGRWT